MSKLTGLVASQFLGVFCEYACKIMVFTLATRPLLSYNDPQLIATLSLLAFLLPKMLFSIPAGIIADRYSKRSVMLFTKAVEASVFLVGAISLYFFPNQMIFPFALLAFLGMQSAIYNPAKSGIVPEIIPMDDVAKGNGILEMWGKVGIFLGTAAGPFFLMFDQGGMMPHLSWTGPLLLSACSLLGLFSTLSVPQVIQAPQEKTRPIKMLIEGWLAIAQNSFLAAIVGGAALYWLVMSFIGQTVLVHAKSSIVDEMYQGVPLGCYWAGIACGALLAGRLRGKIQLVFVGLSLFASAAIALLTINSGMFGSFALLMIMGFAAGLMLVPLQAFVQIEAPKERRGSVIASSNILNMKGILLGSYLSFLLC